MIVVNQPKRVITMKKTLILCVVSGFFGAVLAVAWTTLTGTAPKTVAQELPQVPRPAGRSDVPDPPQTLQPAVQSELGTSPRAEPPPGLDDLTPGERINVAVYENVNRSVVNINTKSVHSDSFFWLEVPSEGEGSGTIIDRQGHLLTNFHVVDGAREIQVTLFNGKTYDASPVGADPTNDVAVLKIEAPAEELYPVVFGESTRLRVGQRVFAIGNPFGLERTLTTGIISSLNRSLPSRRNQRTIKQIIQIDAAINPGNSGGPLLDSRSRMIGMNTAIASKTGESAGVGFAIPINTIARIVPDLIQNGRVVRPDIGIARVYQTDKGLLIATLTPGGAAERAGLKGPQVVRRRKQEGPFVYEYRTIDRSAADLIVGIDGKRIRTADDLLTLIESKKPGDRVVLTVVRDGREVGVPVTLEATE